jgi:hypothetical protein
MDPALIYGPVGVITCLLYAVVHLYRENTQLRKEASELLKTYQQRDEEERRYWKERERTERARNP